MSTVTLNAQQYTDEGLRVLLAEDYFIYVVNESEGLIYCYETEMWIEWIDPRCASVSLLIPNAHHYTPFALAKMTCNYSRAHGPKDQMTLAEWEADHAKTGVA